MHARCPDVDRGGTGPRPGLELADILRRHLDGYRQSHALSLSEQAVLRDLMSCRTAALGGHMDTCTACGFERPSYNSCRNRHCPKCQALAQARWVEARLDRILPVPHFHLVFTLPSDLRQLCRQSPAVMFDILLKAAAASIATLARDPKWLGAKVQPGVTAVLHTWTRKLEFHPHAHCIVTGGGLALDGSRWVAAKPDFLFPVRVLGALFRGKFLAALENAIRDGAIRDDLSDRAARRRRRRLYKTSWIVYAKRPFGGPEQVFRYLGQYTHRVAISNARLLSDDGDQIVFRTRGSETASVPPADFIGRFLQHLLPKRFVKIRHFGLHASTNVGEGHRLDRARALIAASAEASPNPDQAPQVPSPRLAPDLTWSVLLLVLTGDDLTLCPNCHQRSLVRQPLPLTRGPPSYPAHQPAHP
jgi:hypothetical protein